MLIKPNTEKAYPNFGTDAQAALPNAGGPQMNVIQHIHVTMCVC